ncbi:hypothetical protein [Desulfosporosinus sp.]|uniref:hypothetical protein n=1 Tax=Desulfosporosinus sp. TaxID=157907 RepID=UPI0025BCF462|nr:hypothetical protein [Desulfosporosinus sp.]MBC2728460.1 hypothetical protein [Desulfosporosinus sp.]
MNAQEILNYLELLANNSLWVNFSMHVLALMALISVFMVTKEYLKRWVFQGTVSILFLSVAINAFIFGNPFHMVTFSLLAITALVQLFVGKENIRIAESRWITAIALSFILIGLWYPEFVDKNALMLLVVSPVGVIPCPTLLTTIGLLMLIMPSVSRFQYVITIIMGIVYGVIGVFVFKVYLDITLLILVLYASWIYFRSSSQAKTKTVLCSQLEG